MNHQHMKTNLYIRINILKYIKMRQKQKIQPKAYLKLGHTKKKTQSTYFSLGIAVCNVQHSEYILSRLYEKQTMNMYHSYLYIP